MQSSECVVPMVPVSLHEILQIYPGSFGGKIHTWKSCIESSTHVPFSFGSKVGINYKTDLQLCKDLSTWEFLRHKIDPDHQDIYSISVRKQAV